MQPHKHAEVMGVGYEIAPEKEGCQGCEGALSDLICDALPAGCSAGYIWVRSVAPAPVPDEQTDDATGIVEVSE